MKYTLLNISLLHKKDITPNDMLDLMESLKHAKKKERNAMWDYILTHGIKPKSNTI
jgi:hypothetical protein